MEPYDPVCGLLDKPWPCVLCLVCGLYLVPCMLKAAQGVSLACQMQLISQIPCAMWASWAVHTLCQPWVPCAWVLGLAHAAHGSQGWTSCVHCMWLRGSAWGTCSMKCMDPEPVSGADQQGVALSTCPGLTLCVMCSTHSQSSPRNRLRVAPWTDPLCCLQCWVQPLHLGQHVPQGSPRGWHMLCTGRTALRHTAEGLSWCSPQSNSGTFNRPLGLDEF